MRNGPAALAPSPSDATLLRDAHAGDSAAFAAVYDRHAGAAFRLADRLMHGRSAAEDVVQDAFLTLWRSGGFDPSRGSLRSYLLAIVHSRAVDRLRRDARSARYASLDEDDLQEHLPAADRTDLDVERLEVGRTVRAALAELPDAQRRALELSYFGGLSQPEIALILREPLGTVKSRMRLGLEKLGRDLEVAACR